MEKNKSKTRKRQLSTETSDEQRKKLSLHLQETDPEFYEFLKDEDPDIFTDGTLEGYLDELNEAGLEEEMYDEDGNDTEDSFSADDDDSEFGDENTAEDDFEADVDDNQPFEETVLHKLKNDKISALRFIVGKFAAAVAEVGVDVSKFAVSGTVNGIEDVNAILRYCFTLFPSMWINIVKSNAIPSKRSRKKGKWRKLFPLVRTYLKLLLRLIPELQNADVLAATLTHVLKVIQYYSVLLRTSKMLLRKLISVWTTKEEKCRRLAYDCIEKLVKMLPEDVYEMVFRRMYLAYVRNSKIITYSNWSSVHLMQDCFSSLCLVQPSITYKNAFLFIRQLAISLRNAYTQNTKKAINSVHSWHFVQSINLWCHVLVQHPNQRIWHPLRYPVVQVSFGCMRLLPSAKCLPLMFLITKSLLKLSEHCKQFIPVHLTLIKILQMVDLDGKVKRSSLKPIDFDCTLKVSSSQMLESGFKVAVMENLIELLLNFFHLHRFNVAFPELIFIPMQRLNKYVKKCRCAEFSMQIKDLCEVLRKQSAFIVERRRGAMTEFAKMNSGTSELNIAVKGQSPLELHFCKFKAIKEREKDIKNFIYNEEDITENDLKRATKVKTVKIQKMNNEKQKQNNKKTSENKFSKMHNDSVDNKHSNEDLVVDWKEMAPSEELLNLFSKANELEQQSIVIHEMQKIREITEREKLCSCLEEYFQRCNENVDVVLFGSSVNGFGWQNSDVDMTVFYRSTPTKGKEVVDSPGAPIEKFYKLLQKWPGLEGKAHLVQSKRCPLIHFRCDGNYRCELSLNNIHSVRTTQWLRQFADTYSEWLPRLASLIRFWISEYMNSKDEKFNSYPLLLMLITFLRQSGYIPYKCDLFEDEMSELTLQEENCKKIPSVSRLFAKFVCFLDQLPWTLRDVVFQPRRADVVPSMEFLAESSRLAVDKSVDYNLFKFSHVNVQDPLDCTHNPAGSIRRNAAFLFRIFVQRTWRMVMKSVLPDNGSKLALCPRLFSIPPADEAEDDNDDDDDDGSGDETMDFREMDRSIECVGKYRVLIKPNAFIYDCLQREMIEKCLFVDTGESFRLFFHHTLRTILYTLKEIYLFNMDSATATGDLNDQLNAVLANFSNFPQRFSVGAFELHCRSTASTWIHRGSVAKRFCLHCPESKFPHNCEVCISKILFDVTGSSPFLLKLVGLLVNNKDRLYLELRMDSECRMDLGDFCKSFSEMLVRMQNHCFQHFSSNSTLNNDTDHHQAQGAVL
ncbi:Nucleolar complex protein 2 -like protein [Trichinella pseudospiralis]|uniref:Nucleolar complex protein 2-like protein n=1 Tax=Trichinella pseudospiralis TaxID=6337 RepID=A0A0V1FZ82_TRIPS|nr:Nucleolar complex protein 2 -like protein [Trichinella pseudospiralis]